MTDAPAKSAKARYAAAMALLQQARWDEALEIFGALHQANPGIAEVEYQIARIFTRFDRFDRALPHAAAAARLAPAEPAVWAAFADAVALDGGADVRAEFLKVLKAAALPEPARRTLAARFGRAVLPEAQAAEKRAAALAAAGRVEEAITAFRAALALAPDHVAALSGLGSLLLAKGDAKGALRWLDRAATLAPQREDIRRAQGNARTILRDYAGARDAFAAAVRLTGARAAPPLMMLAQAEAHLGDDAAAEGHFAAAVALEPKNAAILGAKGLFLQGLGRFAEAEAVFETAIAADPAVAETYRLYYASHKAQPGEPRIAEMERRFRAPATKDADRMAFGFALAKALEDVKDYGRVFDFLDPANALMRKAHPYDVAEREDAVTRLIAAMEGMDWSLPVPEASTAAPIFVTGMPRSGTTLVEQIIASHSRVTGAGELADGTVSAQRLLPGGPKGGFRAATAIGAAEFARLGHDYAAMIAERFPGADRITDKSIQTYLTLGLTKLALPNARFIVVRRDPRDTLLSIYKNVFPAGTHLYAYDQLDLARYYSTFVRMVDFWRERVPGWFHEVQYEELVAEPEAQSRALIAACGLDWEDACLNFHQNTRKVETLSVFQVRQPISKGSVAAWERYGDRLAPMLGQLARDGHI